jgi:hypothetical protein
MSHSKGFWKVAVTNQSQGSGPLHAAVTICDSLDDQRQRAANSSRRLNSRCTVGVGRMAPRTFRLCVCSPERERSSARSDPQRPSRPTR